MILKEVVMCICHNFGRFIDWMINLFIVKISIGLIDNSNSIYLQP